MLLAIDTSTSLVGAAVHDGDVLRSEVAREDVRRHGELLAPAVQAALGEAGCSRRDVTVVAVGVGPGPFTGLRVGVVTALVLGHVLGVPVHGLCSLDAMAADAATSASAPADLLVATDARRKEVYWARYAVSGGLARRVQGPGVARATDLPEDLRGLPAVGRGPDLYPEALHGIPGPRDVRPGALASLAVRALAGHGPDTVLLPPEPLYLRRPDAVAAAPAGARAR
ncbi:tRNA (adenosine(37)-N6)-threonylcarbamoyltransferase complex dimerization subunit type 1 TsaB [Ornithinimicrobium sediminis]|uniref:tRNA (adenosine(37)-N6)-threonylcarbamoyltransferase complex dimerization subunit type 1 TsaB n=1 Tax=Ornithinimicrobium sediminis TaxID=2904603 RepID=UPI001E642712|nr:tRNA (adenosine(37)-N6)-threonylcarbamoyltransferase complex dimerization subunit type 1 TsaB [Ornithinimicrobium sediminis]